MLFTTILSIFVLRNEMFLMLREIPYLIYTININLL